jgi:hypothetical protein
LFLTSLIMLYFLLYIEYDFYDYWSARKSLVNENWPCGQTVRFNRQWYYVFAKSSPDWSPTIFHHCLGGQLLCIFLLSLLANKCNYKKTLLTD